MHGIERLLIVTILLQEFEPVCKSRSLSDKNGLKLLIALTFLLVVVLNARAPVLRFEVYLAELVATA